MNDLKTTNSIFENIKHIDEKGNEYWSARELQKALEYNKWQKFEDVISKAKSACINSNNNVEEHFTQVGKMINLAKGAKRKIKDYKLSRYACYLIAQNADSRKEVVALAQTYFAIQTRKQELLEEDIDELIEIEKRKYQRNLTKKANLSLNKTASKSGVRNFGKFHNEGYKGLYNGETANDISKRKKLRYREDILDNMGSVELAANWFRITQTEEKIKNKNIIGEENCNKTHYNTGVAVRNFIKRQGSTLPENLPTPNKSLKKIENKKESSKTLL